MCPLVELCPDGQFDVQRIAVVEFAQGPAVLSFVKVDPDAVTVATSPAVQDFTLGCDIGTFGRLFRCGTRINHRWFWFFWPWADSFQIVQVNFMFFLSAHSFPGEHPVTSVDIVTFARNWSRNFSVYFASLCARKFTGHSVIFRAHGAERAQPRSGLDFLHGARFTIGHWRAPLSFSTNGPVESADGEVTRGTDGTAP